MEKRFDLNAALTVAVARVGAEKRGKFELAVATIAAYAVAATEHRFIKRTSGNWDVIRTEIKKSMMRAGMSNGAGADYSALAVWTVRHAVELFGEPGVTDGDGNVSPFWNAYLAASDAEGAATGFERLIRSMKAEKLGQLYDALGYAVDGNKTERQNLATHAKARLVAAKKAADAAKVEAERKAAKAAERQAAEAAKANAELSRLRAEAEQAKAEAARLKAEAEGREAVNPNGAPMPAEAPKAEAEPKAPTVSPTVARLAEAASHAEPEAEATGHGDYLTALAAVSALSRADMLKIQQALAVMLADDVPAQDTNVRAA